MLVYLRDGSVDTVKCCHTGMKVPGQLLFVGCAASQQCASVSYWDEGSRSVVVCWLCSITAMC